MKKDTVGSLIVEWIVQLKAPSIVLAITTAFAAVFFSIGEPFYAMIFLVSGIITEVATILDLMNRTNRFVGYKS